MKNLINLAIILLVGANLSFAVEKAAFTYVCKSNPGEQAAMVADKEFVLFLNNEKKDFYLMPKFAGGFCAGKVVRRDTDSDATKRYMMGGSKCPADGFDLTMDFVASGTGVKSLPVRVEANDDIIKYSCTRID